MTHESAGDWLRQNPNVPFIVEGNKLLWSNGGRASLSQDIPSRFPLHIDGSHGTAELYLEGHSVGRLHLDRGPAHVIGQGVVERLLLESPTPAELLLGRAVHVEELDATRAKQVSLTPNDARVDVLRMGDGSMVGPPSGLIVGELSVVSTARVLLPNTSVRSETLTGPESIYLASGTVVTETLTATAVTLSEGAQLAIGAARHDPLLVVLEGGQFRLHGADTVAENVTFRGSHGVVGVQQGSLRGAHFEVAAPCTLEIHERSEVFLADGAITLTVANGLLVGSEESGIQLKGLPDTLKGAELENIDFFVLEASMITRLATAHRVTAWWPSRKIAHARSQQWTGGLRAEEARTVARAHYWGQVERLLREKGARGRDLVIAHEIVQNTRRLAAKRHTAERRFLGISRFFGYTAQPLRPILIWAALAIPIAVLVRAFAGDLCWCNFGSWFDLWVDVLISPVTWVRQVGDESELTTLVEASSASELAAFSGRVVGTVALGATALAVRRYVLPAQG